MFSEKQFLEAIGEHQQIIQKVCNLYADSVADRQDLLQEIMLNAWKGARNFKGESKFSTWLYRVALNTAMTFLKKDKKYQSMLDATADAGHRPDIASGEEDQQRAMERAIQDLSNIDKALVTLYLDDLDYQQIADIMGITSNNVAVKMNRIRARLRDLAKKYLN